jgi:hypothetical protein
MLRDIRTHRHLGGRVVCLDYDRFARPVDGRLRVSDIEYQRQRIALHDAGWELDYVLTPKTGNAMQDALVGAMKSAMSGEYIEKLSAVSRAGKRRAAVAGNWNGGPPPWPAERIDARTGRRLARGERASNGQAVLGPPSNPDKLQHWIDGANLLLCGASLDAVARMLTARGVESFYGGTWRHAHVVKVFTAVELIGRVEYRFATDDGGVELFEGPARWEPIVPVDLFHAVRSELTKRARKRAPANPEYVLDLECFACGARWVAATTRTRGKTRRQYTHPVPTSRMNDEQAGRTRASGCRHWYLDAEQAEAAVRDLVISQRGSRAFADLFAQLLDEQRALEGKASALEQDAERRLKDADRRRANLRASLELADTPETRQALVTRISELTRELLDAQQLLQRARGRRERTIDGNRELLRLVEEAANLQAAWATPGREGIERRRTIIDTWVEKALVEVIPEPGRQRGNERRLYIYLRTMPHSPLLVPLQPMERQSPSESLRSMVYEIRLRGLTEV